MDRRHIRIVFVCLIAAHLFLDLTAPVFMLSALERLQSPGIVSLITGTVVGMALGQIGLLATWAALGPEHIVVRLLRSVFILVLAWYAMIAGFRVRLPFVPNDVPGFRLLEALAMLLVAAVAFFALQGPLWLIRAMSRSRIDLAHGEESQDNVAKTQFSILQLLIWTAAIALVLGFGRLALPGADEYQRIRPPMIWLVWPALVASLFTFVVLLPTLWASFQRTGAVGWLFGLAVFTLFVTLFEVAILSAIFGGPGDDAFAGLLGLNYGVFAVTALSCLLLRKLGFQFVRKSAGSPRISVVAQPPRAPPSSESD